jgi:hypothetical protein
MKMVTGVNENGEELNAIGEVILKDGTKTLDDFVDHCKRAMRIVQETDPKAVFYLTGAKIGGSTDEHRFVGSYRLFVGEQPTVTLGCRGHYDTGRKGFIVKVYHQPFDCTIELAKILSGSERQFSLVEEHRWGECHRFSSMYALTKKD